MAGDNPTAKHLTAAALSQRIPSRHGIWVLPVILTVITLATRLINIPINRIIELRYCKKQFSQPDPSKLPKKVCKVPEVQRPLAWLEGTMATLIIICGKLTYTSTMSPSNHYARSRYYNSIRAHFRPHWSQDASVPKRHGHSYHVSMDSASRHVTSAMTRRTLIKLHFSSHISSL